MKIIQAILCVFLLKLFAFEQHAQGFYFGADQSYVNEMEDCGAMFKEDGVIKDLYNIYADHGCNLTRLRLWHTPSWYDKLNNGKRYSDLSDVTKSIQRSKDAGIEVLLNFHLSDNWADPSKQLVPKAWLSVVDDTELLGDSLYQYIYNTLKYLYSRDLLPEMVQIGNETNRGILLSPKDNQTWTLDWERNAYLFNKGISAVRDINKQLKDDIQIMLHVAGPADIEWFMNSFIENEVTDFDIIGMSYYWAWHQPAEISDAEQVIRKLKEKFPNKQIIVVETGYPWTLEAFDNANNIITALHPDYSPASPENQKKWLIDLTSAVMEAGGQGVVYWEPSWVSTPCWNQWDQGSHQEHATFFDFEYNLLKPGGIEWMEYNYGTTSTINVSWFSEKTIRLQADSQSIQIIIPEDQLGKVEVTFTNLLGQTHLTDTLIQTETIIKIPNLSERVLIVALKDSKDRFHSKKIILKK